MEDADSRHWTKYKSLAGTVIESFKALGPECRQSGDDSGLDDVWEEFKSQIQEGESFFFDAYEHTLQSFCNVAVKDLSTADLELLWVNTDAWAEHEDEDNATADEMRDGIAAKLYDTVCDIATDEPIHEDEEEYDAEEEEESPEDEPTTTGADQPGPVAEPPAVADNNSAVKAHHPGEKGQLALELD